MKNYRKFLIAAVVCLLLPTGAAFGQPADKDTRKVVFSGGTDIVSSYVWRGVYETGPAIQPVLSMNLGNFSATAWGSVDFNAAYKEMDITLTYQWGTGDALGGRSVLDRT